MQFITYPSSENMARLIILPGDMVSAANSGAAYIDSYQFGGGMDGGRFYLLSVEQRSVWCTIPLAYFYDYYRLGSMFAGASPQNLLISLFVSGNNYYGGGLTTDFLVSAWFRNVGDDIGAIPFGYTPFQQTLNVNPLSTGGVAILQKMVMGQMYLNPGQADTSDGLLVVGIDRLLTDNTYTDSIRLYAVTIDMGIKR